jgi:hypothetical protein
MVLGHGEKVPTSNRIIEVVASQIFMGWNTAGKHGFRLFPIFFDKHSKIDVCEETGD